jgi:guanine deaminase
MKPAQRESGQPAPTAVLYRGAVLTPSSAQQWWSCADAGVLVEGETIRAVAPIGEFRDVPATAVHELDGVLLPGFVDVHIHWVQHHVRGRYQDDLLSWLRESIWPEEARFADAARARVLAAAFFADTVRAGTTCGMAYSSPHPAALRIAAEAMRGDWLLGNAVMETAAPEALCAAGSAEAEQLEALADALGARYAVTPRFALNCSADTLHALGELARRRELFIQTHLSESPAEVALVREAFPDALDYTDVYDRAGLLGPRSVLGHCIHLSQREYACLRARGAWIAHCPSSNEALDSGRMDLEAVRRHGIPYALASDVGAGPSHSMLHVMQRYQAQHAAAGVTVTPQEALYRATAAGAQCLGRDAICGRLAPGLRADFALMPRAAAPWRPQAWFDELIRGAPAELETRPLATWIAGVRQSSPPPVAGSGVGSIAKRSVF